jgi:hypothetical protein
MTHEVPSSLILQKVWFNPLLYYLSYWHSISWSFCLEVRIGLRVLVSCPGNAYWPTSLFRLKNNNQEMSAIFKFDFFMFNTFLHIPNNLNRWNHIKIPFVRVKHCWICAVPLHFELTVLKERHQKQKFHFITHALFVHTDCIESYYMRSNNIVIKYSVFHLKRKPSYSSRHIYKLLRHQFSPFCWK